MKPPKDSPPEVQPLPSTHEQRMEAFKVWQEGGKDALGKLLLKNKAAYEKAKAERSKTAEQEADSQEPPVVQGLKAYKEGGKAALAKFLRKQEREAKKNRSKT